MIQRTTRKQGFTLIELLVVIAIISIIAGFLVPTLLRGRGEAYKVQCGNNLKQIYTPAMSYSDKKGTRAFPIARGKNPPAYESLNEMLAFDSEGLSPKLFICPEGEGQPAEPDEDGKYVLDETTLDYTWVGKKVKNTTTGKALSSDKYIQGFQDADSTDGHSGHKGGMEVLFTDGRVEFVLQQDIEEKGNAEEMLPKGLVR